MAKKEKNILSNIKINVKKPAIAKPKLKSKEEITPVKSKKQVFDEDELEDIIEEDYYIEDNNGFFARRAPSLAQRPVVQLETELADIPIAKKEEDPLQQKPGDYSPNQKYELGGSKGYEGMAPKQVTGTPTQDFSNQMFKPAQQFSNTETGYPGQQADRNYQSSLEWEANQKKKQKDNW